MELTEQSLEEVILQIRGFARNKYDVIAVRPTHLLINTSLWRRADRLANPWKGKRAKWLKAKRG